MFLLTRDSEASVKVFSMILIIEIHGRSSQQAKLWVALKSYSSDFTGA